MSTIKGLKKLKTDYVMDCIYTYEYSEATGEVETNLSDKDKLQFVADRLKSEALYENNLKRFNYNLVELIGDHFMGLPSYFNMDYENYKILEVGKKWGYKLDTEKKEDQFIENWFKMLASVLIDQFNKHNISLV